MSGRYWGLGRYSFFPLGLRSVGWVAGPHLWNGPIAAQYENSCIERTAFVVAVSQYDIMEVKELG